MKTKNVFLVIAIWLVLLLPGIVLAQNDFDQSLGQSTQSSGQGNEITIHDQERVTVGSSDDGGQDPQSRIIRFGDGQPVQNGSQYQPPKWETREGLEEAAKAYFTAKHNYNKCKATGDSAGMRRAAARMTSLSRQLDAFKKEQAERDKGQDEKIADNAGKIETLNKQINDKGGINDQLKKTKAKADNLEKEMNDYVTPAIAGSDWKFNSLTLWLLILTIIVIVGFGRRWRIFGGNTR